jgi:hypothetical protein
MKRSRHIIQLSGPLQIKRRLGRKSFSEHCSQRVRCCSASAAVKGRGTMIGIHDSDLFWLAFIAAFVSGMACGWCFRDIRDAWGAPRTGGDHVASD